MELNPYESPQQFEETPMPWLSLQFLIELAVVVCIVGTLCGLLIPAVRAARHAKRRQPPPIHFEFSADSSFSGNPARNRP